MRPERVNFVVSWDIRNGPAAEFATPLQRLRHAEILDRHVEAWTVTQEAHDVMHQLQQAGVPAGIVARASDLHTDAQLQHRRFFSIWSIRKQA